MKAPKPPFKTTASLFVVLIVCGVLFSADTEVCKKCSCEWKLVAPACFLLGCFTENNTCDDNTLTLSFDASFWSGTVLASRTYQAGVVSWRKMTIRK
jgi:hypothetical protein